MYVSLDGTTEAISRFLKSSPNLSRGGDKMIEIETEAGFSTFPVNRLLRGRDLGFPVYRQSRNRNRILLVSLYRPFQYRDRGRVNLHVLIAAS